MLKVICQSNYSVRTANQGGYAAARLILKKDNETSVHQTMF